MGLYCGLCMWRRQPNPPKPHTRSQNFRRSHFLLIPSFSGRQEFHRMAKKIQFLNLKFEIEDLSDRSFGGAMTPLPPALPPLFFSKDSASGSGSVGRPGCEPPVKSTLSLLFESSLWCLVAAFIFIFTSSSAGSGRRLGSDYNTTTYRTLLST